MTPILYEKDEIDFTSQGLGSLVEIYDADVAEQRNGLLQFTASYPVTGVRYDDISVGRIILAKPNQRDEPHAFRITSTDLDIMGHNVMIEADSITYDLNHNIVKHVSVNGQSGQAMMTALQMAVVNPSIFTFYSDITHVSSTSLDYVNPMEAVMGVKGSFLQIWGGELKRENRRVAMFNRRGRDNVATFRLGKNISGLKYKVDISSLVTRILPIKSVQENDTTTYLEGTPVSSQYINSYEQIYTIKVDFTDDKIKTVDDLNKASANWFVDSANTARDKPSVTIDIDVLSLQDSADYQDKFKDLESVALTDTVTVYVPEYGINVTAIVNEIHFDPIQERVTKLTVGTARMSFADSSRVQLSDLQDKVISVQEQADQIAVSANGKSTNYYGSVEPSHPQEGDTWFWVDGDKSGVKVFVDGDWVEPVDSDTQEKIEDAVTDAVTQAKAYSDQLVADNVAQVNAVLDDVQAKQADLTAQQAELDTKAQGYADKALADAKADTLATATQTANDAQDALDSAKTALTTSLNKEVTDRANAVSDLDTKAQGYATQAKTDAIATANGAVAKEVTDRQKAITDLDAKSTGAINQAKTDAQSALDALQVGTRNLFLNSKTLWNVSSNGGTVTKEAFDATTNMWHITSPLGSGDNRGLYFNIANNTSTPIPVGQPWTMSFDIKGTGLFRQVGPENSTTKGLTGNVPTDWTRVSATGIRTTANNVVMYFYATTVALDVYIKLPKLEQGTKATDYTQSPEDIVLDYTTKDNVISQSLTQYQATNDGKVTKAQSDATQALGLVATKVSQTTFDTKTGDLGSKYTAVKQTADQASTDIVAIKSTNTSQDTKINTLTSDVSGTKQSISDIQTEQGKQSTKINTIQTDVSGTKQDISDIQDANGVQDGKIASISTTVDGLSSSFSTYKTTNDGKVAKAQSDITANATAISQKVSQTAYDTKTGQLQTDLNTTTTTANKATTDILAIKSDNTKQDARMTTIESDANGIKTTVSSLQTTANTQAGSISTLQQRADGFDATVTKVNTQLNDLSQVNMVVNSEFSPDLAGWYIRGTSTLLSDGPNSSDVGFNKSGHVVLDTTSGTGTGNVNYTSMAYPVPSSSIISVSAELKASVSGTYPQIGFIYYDADMNAVAGQRGGVPVTTDYKLWKYTGTAIPATAKYVSFDILISSAYKAKYVMSQPMMVIGSPVGAYVQGQYNNNGATAKAQLTADQATTSLNTYKSDADGRISKAQADIIVNANAITQKVSQSDHDAKTGDLTTKVNTAQSTADSATSTIGSYKTANDARVASAESKITANATAITQKVSQTDYNTKTGQIDGQISTINHPAGGGYLRYAFYDSTKTHFNRVPAPANNSATYSKWVITTPANTAFIRISFDYTANNGSKVKFEQGNLATNWSPAPEDTDNKISTVSQTVDSISSIVSDPTTGLSKRVQTAEGSISTVQSNVSDLQTKQTQTANGLTTEISDRQKGDTNTLTQAKSFTTSSISNSESGMKSLITQTSDSIIAKVDTKTDSATVLSLLKDNWSIGIADNAGAITNGIVGNSTNMSLISNNVVINAPSTQIKGTAWINSAMIGNGQIGNAQIGDASISSAKIMNLDVNKITGNVSNWVLSQWTSATGSKVTIDGNGLYFSPGTSRMTADGFEAWRFEEGHYAAMGLVGSYNWVSNSDMNGIGLIAKYYDRAHTSAGDPYRDEIWGADTIAIGGLQPEVGKGYGYIDPFMIFPANATIGERYFPGNGDDTIIMSRRLSIYTGLNMHGTAITNSSGYSLKENFKPILGTDALDIFDNTDFVSYDYIPLTDDIDEQATAERKNKVGFVINDNGQSPYKTDSRLIRYGNTRDDSVTVGYLMAAVKELHAKVKELTTKLEAQK